MNTGVRENWDLNAATYDLFEKGGSLRHAPYKRALFGNMAGRVLFVAAGTGADFCEFPAGLKLVAIDLSWKMLEQARKRAAKYDGRLVLLQTDVEELPFEDCTFDTVATSSTFCSVPNPVAGLKELHRVLQPGGKLLMFEHVRSRNWIIGGIQDAMTLSTRRLGPEMNRPTSENVRKSGFAIEKAEKVYLDVFLAITARRLSDSGSKTTGMGAVSS